MDRLIRLLTGAIVLAVATFAAIVSYTHIYDLGRAHGQ
jgi:predicted small integral membrane protein